MNNGKKNILVIDDNADITDFIKQNLEYLYPSEYHVICVNCGKKCFGVLEKNDSIPDLILLDISMPEMDGWEVLDCLKRNPQWRYIPIIFLSGKTDQVAKNFGKIFGDDFIEKPFEIKNLKERIDKILKQYF
jgi:CheY-like chemotaxis protein